MSLSESLEHSLKDIPLLYRLHEVTSFEDQLEEVTQPVFSRARGVTISLSAAERAAVRQIAASRGVDEDALLREWVQEKLHH